MNLKDARAFALSLPESTEEPHFDKASFRVGGKIFATVPPGGTHLHVFVDEHDARAAVAEAPGAVEELWWGKRLSGVRIALRPARRDLVVELLEEAWRRRAPARVVRAFDEANAGVPDPGR